MKLKQQVSPRVAAAAIVVVLVIVQVVWWRGLVMKPKAHPPGGGGGGGGGGPDLLLTGRPDVTVETISGDIEPGYIDGPGRDARFDGPGGLALDPAGNLLVAD